MTRENLLKLSNLLLVLALGFAILFGFNNSTASTIVLILLCSSVGVFSIYLFYDFQKSRYFYLFVILYVFITPYPLFTIEHLYGKLGFILASIFSAGLLFIVLKYNISSE